LTELKRAISQLLAAGLEIAFRPCLPACESKHMPRMKWLLTSWKKRTNQKTNLVVALSMMLNATLAPLFRGEIWLYGAIRCFWVVMQYATAQWVIVKKEGRVM
jgi:hypothetical protein